MSHLHLGDFLHAVWYGTTCFRCTQNSALALVSHTLNALPMVYSELLQTLLENG